MNTLVTGASSGIGHALAARLVADGTPVLGMARRSDAMPEGVTALPADLTVPGAATAALGNHPVRALVHCAGYGDFAPLELTSADEARDQLAVNLLSAAELVSAVLPGMRASREGRIVLVSSIASRFSSPMGGWYHASKAALEAYADALRQEVAPFGVHVSVVQPGVVRTAWHATAMDRLVTRTSGTPYAEAGAATAAYHQRSAEGSMACAPEVVVAAILDALRAPRPRTRYLVGRGSRVAVTLPRLVGDRAFDAMTRRQFGIAAR